MNKARLEKISEHLRLSPYQTYILSMNMQKYKMDRLVKRGDVLYAPYRCSLPRGMRDYFSKLFLGPRADLIGADRMLVIGRRGIRLYPTGFYKACDNTGRSYYADSMGQKIERSLFEDILGL
ncbi:MAG: hypothetical protein LBK26_04130 [Rickettsiales bacterium]|jgi:hypothetical protein|nr:hypothetical protein [Rickettsiales bacterium]